MRAVVAKKWDYRREATRRPPLLEASGLTGDDKPTHVTIEIAARMNVQSLQRGRLRGSSKSLLRGMAKRTCEFHQVVCRDYRLMARTSEHPATCRRIYESLVRLQGYIERCPDCHAFNALARCGTGYALPVP